MRWHIRATPVLAYIITFTKQQSVIIDDRDASITFWAPSGFWTLEEHAGLLLYNSTITLIGMQGATANFKFKGTDIEYWGVKNMYMGQCLVTLDGKNETMSMYFDGYGPSNLLYHRGDLDPAVEHTIVITVISNSAPNGCNIDRFVYVPVGNTSATETSTPTSASLLTGTDSGSPAQTNTVDGSNSNLSHSDPPLAAIIGGSIGGTLVLLIAALSWCLCRQRNRKITEETNILLTTQKQPSSPSPGTLELSDHSDAKVIAAFSNTTWKASADGRLPPASGVVSQPHNGSGRGEPVSGEDASHDPLPRRHSGRSLRPLRNRNLSQSFIGSAGSQGIAADPDNSYSPPNPLSSRRRLTRDSAPDFEAWTG